MWVSAAIVRPGVIGPAAVPVAEFLRTTGAAPAMVVDGRAYDARSTATATYRLMKDLGLTRAQPVACWSARAPAAHDHLALVLSALPPGETALVVAATVGGSSRWGAALVTVQPASTSARQLSRPANDGPPGHGFLILIAAAAGQPH